MDDFTLNGGGPVHRARIVVENMADLMGENAGDFLVRKAMEQALGDRDAGIVGAAEGIGVHARDRQQKQFRHALHPGADTNIEQNRIKLRRLCASQGFSAQSAQGGARLALRRLQIGLDLVERLSRPARFAVRLPAKVEQIYEARKDATGMMRVEFPRQPPPQLRDGQSLSARLSETLAAFDAKALAGKNTGASMSWKSHGMRQHSILRSCARDTVNGVRANAMPIL